MTLTIATLAFLWFAPFDGLPTVARGKSTRAEVGTRDPHIRATVPALADTLAAGIRDSPTLKALVETIEASDLLVYLTFDRAPAASTAGHIAWMTAAGGRRYVRLVVNPRYDRWQRIAILGHELRHAVEIADARWVIDQRSLVSLYRRIGFSSGERSFESAAAIAAGQQVHEEMRQSQRAHATPTQER
jgi:hypothetical protein